MAKKNNDIKMAADKYNETLSHCFVELSGKNPYQKGNALTDALVIYIYS